MTGKHCAGVFDARSTLDSGLKEVAELGGDVDDSGEDEALPKEAQRCQQACCLAL